MPLKFNIKNPEFRFVKFESKDIRLEDPVDTINDAINDIFEYDQTCKDKEDFLTKCQEILEYYNESMEIFGVQLKLRKGNPMEKHKRPWAIRIERVGMKEIPENIIQQYGIIQKNRLNILKKIVWSSLNEYLQEEISLEEFEKNLLTSKEDYSIQLNIAFNDIAQFLIWWKKELAELLRKQNLIENSFFASSGLDEILNILCACIFSANNGFFRSAYQSFRDLLEWVIHIIFIDFYQERKLGDEFEDPYVKALFLDNWHKYLQSGDNYILRNPIEIKNLVGRRLYDQNINLFETYKISKQVLIDLIIKHFSTSLFIGLTGQILCAKHAKKVNFVITGSSIDRYFIYNLESLLFYHLYNQNITDIEINTPLFSEFEEFHQNFTQQFQFELPKCEWIEAGKNCTNEAEYFGIKIPTTNTLLYLAFKRIDFNEKDIAHLSYLYNRYSYFIHPYPLTRQGAPFSSKLEVELWLGELHKYLQLLNRILCNYTAFFRANCYENFFFIFNEDKHCKNCPLKSSNYDIITKEMISYWPKFI